MSLIRTWILRLIAILSIIIVTYFATISLVVISQEVHVLVGIAGFALLFYAAFKLFQARLTRF